MVELRPVIEPDHLQMRYLKAWQVIDHIKPQHFKEFADLISDNSSNRSVVDLKDRIPWDDYRPPTPRNTDLGGKQHNIYYHVPVGHYYGNSFFRLAKETYDGFEELYPQGTRCLAFSLILSEPGIYLDGSARFSPFALFLEDICAGRFLEIYREMEVKCCTYEEKINDFIVQIGQGLPLTREIIGKIFRHLKGLLPLSECFVEDTEIALEKLPIKEDRPPYSLIDRSFYARDIAFAKHVIASGHGGSSTAIQTYLGGEGPIVGQSDFNADRASLESSIRPQNLPAARWPAPGAVSLNLLQQAAVNAIVQAGLSSAWPIHSINGPPGTGKTTLLRDVIAQIISDRARVLASFESPNKGFQGVKKELGCGHVSQLNPALRGFEILITSSNNRAVENISVELPKRSVVDRELDCPYFEKIAEQVYGNEDCWGLIAAVLGKRKNISAFMSRFWEAANGVPLGMQKRLIDSIAETFKSPERFNMKWDAAVEKYKAADGRVARLKKEFEEEFSGRPILNQIISQRDQIQAPFSSVEMQAARAGLFAAALELHQVFILHQAADVHNNLSAFVRMMNGGPKPTESQLVDLWATFFLVVPVVSTTFASVENMLNRYPAGQLGWVLIDEAGQAEPHQAVGAITRARNVVVVGDPQQLQPIFSLPGHMANAIFAQFGLEDHLTSLSSVQSLADKTSDIFHIRGDGVRVGSPLLVHRRCEMPMFSVSNRVAYRNEMIMATPIRLSRIKSLLGQSAWVDVRPSSEGIHHWNPAEWDALQMRLDIMRDARADPDFYILSPFRGVADKARHRMREYLKTAEGEFWFESVGQSAASWLKDRIGSVHTSQGREAEAVFALMGAGNSFGARQWAGSTPNLVNVMASRAKSAIYVFGALGEWSHENNMFSVLAKSLLMQSSFNSEDIHDAFNFETSFR